MEYFMYSPVDMTDQQAFIRACRYLDKNHIVVVRTSGIETLFHNPEVRPQAIQGMYLVRVEPDGSLRIVHQNLE